ncbi:DUF2652 domain-containing protein [Arenimonas sp.]|uniref:DUF2652 domain-containing protein n=1 Tax=Arenimonas sp. TaxID=1872635 RepID=UPI0039E57029
MRLTQAVLVVADISGYTDFITNREISLLHAEQIITDLLESMLDRTEHPLIANKLEGDAALLYAEHEAGDENAAVRDALLQVRALFDAFDARLRRIGEERANCGCEACANISRLCLKAFVHRGEIAIKQVRQFEELAGEPVIFVHRLMKNGVPLREYVLLSGEAARCAGLPLGTGQAHREALEGLGEHELWLLLPSDLTAP